LIRGAKSEHWTAKRAGDETDAALWKERVERMGGLVEGLLGEVKVNGVVGPVAPQSGRNAADPGANQSLVVNRLDQLR